MTAAFGICAAVLGRMTSGEGTYLDVSMTDVLATWTGPAGARPADDAGGDSRAGPIPGYGLFATADGGQIALGVINEQHFWASLCEALAPRTGLAASASTSAAGGAPSSSTPSPRPSPARPGTSWWPAWPPPACPSPRCSTAGACWPPPRSPGSRSGSPLPKRRGPSRRSTSTAARASPTRLTPDDRQPCCYGPADACHRSPTSSDANQAYAAARAHVADPRPSRHLAVVTCMDARIDVFAVLGLHLGEAHVIRNAGGRVTEDVLRSLALSSAVLGVDTAVVMQHTKCGLFGVDDAQLRELTGADLGFLPIDDHVAALREDVDQLARTPYLSRLQ